MITLLINLLIMTAFFIWLKSDLKRTYRFMVRASDACNKVESTVSKMLEDNYPAGNIYIIDFEGQDVIDYMEASYYKDIDSMKNIIEKVFKKSIISNRL